MKGHLLACLLLTAPCGVAGTSEDYTATPVVVDGGGSRVTSTHYTQTGSFVAGAVGEREGDLRDFFAALARKADTNEALAVGEDDAVVMVIPGVPLVTLHHRELDAVDELPPQISCNE